MGRAVNDNQIKWDDIQVGLGAIQRPGGTDPTYRSYNHGVVAGVEFDVLGFAVNDYVTFDIQTSHSMKLNTILDVHMHFILPNVTDIGDKFQFQLDVIVAGIGSKFAVPVGSPFTSEHTIVANDNNSHRLMELGDIPASNTTVSSIYSCRLTRIAATSDEYASEVYIKYLDSHYQKDDRGSQNEQSK